jgi:IS605 OrfB family transposase
MLVFEDRRGLPQPERGAVRGKALRRRLAQWARREIRAAVERKAQQCGLAVAEVDPAWSDCHW